MTTEPDELIPTRWSLIRRLKDWDDQEGWREFFDIYWKLIYGVAMKSGLTHQEAEEVVQNTTISVCKNIKAFRAEPSRGSFKGWLLKLTRWRIKDQIRKRTPEFIARAHRKGQRSPDDTSSTPTEERIPDPSGNFLEAIWEDEWKENLMSHALEQVKAKVNVKHFQVFYLLTVKKSSPQQVAKVSAIDVNQVYLIKHRVSQIFQDALKELEEKAS